MANFINVQKAMTEYSEELASIMNVTKQPGVDPLWNTWYDEARFYEPAGKVDIEINEDTCTEPKSKSKKSKYGKNCSKRANRRRQTFYYRMRLQRNAEAIQSNYEKRIMEDMNNLSFSKKRGGRKVTDPKSLATKSDVILKRALRMDVVPADFNKEELVTEQAHWTNIDMPLMSMQVRTIWNNLCDEDENKLTYCKMYNGRKVLGKKSVKILKKALKSNLVPFDLRDDIACHLEKLENRKKVRSKAA